MEKKNQLPRPILRECELIVGRGWCICICICIYVRGVGCFKSFGVVLKSRLFGGEMKLLRRVVGYKGQQKL